MKMITTLSLAAITALFIGCGSSSSGGSDTSSSSSSSSSLSSSSSSISNSSTASSVSSIGSSSSINNSSSESSSSESDDLSSITVTSPTDVKGYRFTSKEASFAKDTTALFVVEFDCNDKFYYTQHMKYKGQEIQIDTRGTDINVGDTAWGNRLDWSGKEVGDEDETHNNAIYIDAFDKITVDKSCFADEDCLNGFYVESIEKTATCK